MKPLYILVHDSFERGLEIPEELLPGTSKALFEQVMMGLENLKRALGDPECPIEVKAMILSAFDGGPAGHCPSGSPMWNEAKTEYIGPLPEHLRKPAAVWYNLRVHRYEPKCVRAILAFELIVEALFAERWNHDPGSQYRLMFHWGMLRVRFASTTKPAT